jgi:hypothetical protein
MRIWNALLAWLGINNIDTSTWEAMDTIKDWWLSFIYPQWHQKKVFRISHHACSERDLVGA